MAKSDMVKVNKTECKVMEWPSLLFALHKKFPPFYSVNETYI
jgi:hypothetical protein